MNADCAPRACGGRRRINLSLPLECTLASVGLLMAERVRALLPFELASRLPACLFVEIHLVSLFNRFRHSKAAVNACSMAVHKGIECELHVRTKCLRRTARRVLSSKSAFAQLPPLHRVQFAPPMKNKWLNALLAVI
jgi:hypothetical protein